MKRARNQYRNQVRTGSVARWISAGIILGGFGIGFVYIKNNHVELGARRGAVEEEITMLKRQIDEANGWIARMEDRKNLSVRLQRADSQLVRFAPSRIIKIRPVEPDRPAVRESGLSRVERAVPSGAISGGLAQNDA